MWFDTIHRCTVLSVVLKPTIPPERFWSLLVVCSITWSDCTLLNALRSYQLRTLYRCLGVSFLDFVVCINCKLNDGCSFACHMRASKTALN